MLVHKFCTLPHAIQQKPSSGAKKIESIKTGNVFVSFSKNSRTQLAAFARCFF